MSSLKRIFAAMAAGLALAATGPVHAMSVGEKKPIDTAIEEFQKDKWVPLAVGLLPRPPAPAIAEGTIEAEIKQAAPMLVIFGQKGNDKWRLVTQTGDSFVLRAEGEGLKLSPLQSDNDDIKDVSYKGPLLGAQAIPVQQSGGSARCGPAEAMDSGLKQGSNVARVIEGIETGGQAKHAFYAAYDHSAKWVVTRTTPDNMTCIMAAGIEYTLNPQQQVFVPVWKQNQHKPS